jgi:hypothetical protein
MGIIEHQVRALAPSVKAVVRRFGPPRVGYIVAGYSGGWPDGVMEALKDQPVTRDKIIYWFHRGRLFRSKDLPSPLGELIERSDVRFVQHDDLDYLFIRISGVMNDTMPGSAWLLDELDLFTSPSAHERLLARERLRVYQKRVESDGGSGLLGVTGCIPDHRKLKELTQRTWRIFASEQGQNRVVIWEFRPSAKLSCGPLGISSDGIEKALCRMNAFQTV